MSKCLICGNELVTGDIHWEQGMCNVCWNKTFNKDIEVVGFDLIDIYKDKILILEQQLAEKDRKIKRLKYQLAYYQAQVSQEEIERFNNNMLAQTRPYEELEGKSLYEISQIYQNQIRKQVCDEIRTYDRTTNKQKVSYTEYVMGLCEFLDQVEQGE